MITRSTLAVTGRTRYVSVEKGCRKFSKKKILITHSGSILTREYWHGEEFKSWGYFWEYLPTHHVFPETLKPLMTPVHMRLPLRFHIHYSVKHKSAAFCFFVFFSTFIFQRKHEMLPALWPNEGHSLPSHWLRNLPDNSVANFEKSYA